MHVQVDALRRAAGVLDRFRLGREGGRGPLAVRPRYLEGVVGKPVRVQIPPSAPLQYSKGIRFSAEVPFFIILARVAHLWLAGKNPCGMAATPDRI